MSALPDDRLIPSSLWRGWVSVFGLTGFAVAYPLLRVLGPSPEFFLAHRVEPAAVVAFAVTLAILLPGLVATVAAAADARRWRWARMVLVSTLGAVASAGLLQPIAAVWAFPVLAVAAGVAIAVAERRTRVMGKVLAVCAVGSVLASAWFIGLSRTSSYVFAAGTGVADLPVAPAAPLPPAVFIVFDEFPATALLDSDLDINANRYPNFARLAAESDWYRLASSVSPQTEYSVPAILSGTVPTPQVAVASNYPSNLFLQLGGLYDVYAYQSVTGLCPDSVCLTRTARSDSPSDDAGGSVGELAKDAMVVFAHAVGSDAMRADLPPIDHSWAGFGGGRVGVVDVDVDPGQRQNSALGDESSYVGAAAELLELVGQRPSSGRPPLYAAHVITPHLPYLANPSGSTYERLPLVGMETHDSRLVWPAGGDEAARRQGYQRLLLQLGAVDTLLGQVIAQLEDAGLWDDAAVVVTADHGASFEEGYFRDVSSGGAEVWNVPLFVKHPGQHQGAVHDDPALTIDAVPTLLEVIGLDSPSSFDGVDLTRGEVPGERPGGYYDLGERRTIDQSRSAVRAVVDRRASWIDPDGGWETLYQVGPGGSLVGRPAPPDVGTAAGTWTAPAPAGGVSTVRTLNLELSTDQDPPAGVIVSAEGRMAGTGSPVGARGDGRYEVTVVIEEQAANFDPPDLEVFAVDRDGGLSRLAPEGRP